MKATKPMPVGIRKANSSLKLIVSEGVQTLDMKSDNTARGSTKDTKDRHHIQLRSTQQRA